MESTGMLIGIAAIVIIMIAGSALYLVQNHAVSAPKATTIAQNPSTAGSTSTVSTTVTMGCNLSNVSKVTETQSGGYSQVFTVENSRIVHDDMVNPQGQLYGSQNFTGSSEVNASKGTSLFLQAACGNAIASGYLGLGNIAGFNTKGAWFPVNLASSSNSSTTVSSSGQVRINLAEENGRDALSIEQRVRNIQGNYISVNYYSIAPSGFIVNHTSLFYRGSNEMLNTSLGALVDLYAATCPVPPFTEQYCGVANSVERGQSPTTSYSYT